MNRLLECILAGPRELINPKASTRNREDFAKGLKDVTDRLETRVGKIPLSSRYHRLPHKLEDDYITSRTVLGTGANGAVRLAQGRHMANQKFAVKTLNTPQGSSELLNEVMSEVECFLSLDHPHVTRLYDVYETENQLHFVMECMEGGELFDRIKTLQRFSEQDAANATWQMLLAIKYLHSHGIVHRDLKLENFMLERIESKHLKLIDFGFSTRWDPCTRMSQPCGTLAYVAPEVLKNDYTSQCDMWSMGVITFVLLAGYMPFASEQDTRLGKYQMLPSRWHDVGQDAKHFISCLLEVDPCKRPTVQAALEHPWMQKGQLFSGSQPDAKICKALKEFSNVSPFRRCCMEVVAWSLSNKDRAKVREYFVSMDIEKHGTITLTELKKAMTHALGISENEVLHVFKSMDSNCDEEIQYSDFLAAMVSMEIELDNEHVQHAFQKFDTDKTGYITRDNVKEMVGGSFQGTSIEDLMREADSEAPVNGITYEQFNAYLRGL